MARVVSTAMKVRKFLRKNPTATVAQVMAATNAPKQTVYNIRWAENKKKRESKIVLTPTQVALANKLGITKEQLAEQTHKLNKMRRATRAEKISKPAVYEVPAIVEQHYGIEEPAPVTDNVNHPAHYKVGGIETIDFIEAKKLNYNLGNVIKYITRADHKGNTLEDLAKARWYLNREIAKHTGEAK